MNDQQSSVKWKIFAGSHRVLPDYKEKEELNGSSRLHFSNVYNDYSDTYSASFSAYFDRF